MTDKNKILDYISKHEPGNHRFQLMKIWPEIEEAINLKLEVKTIWNTAKEVHGIDCSYAWFASFVREMKSNKPTSKTKKSASKAHNEISKIASPPPSRSRTKEDEEKELDNLF